MNHFTSRVYEHTKIFPASAVADTGAVSGDVVNCEGVDQIDVVIQVGAQAEALTVTLQQCDNAAGDNPVTVNAKRHFFTPDATPSPDGTLTVEDPPAATVAIASGSGAGKFVVSVRPQDDFDLNVEKPYFRVTISGSTTRTQTVNYLMSGFRYGPANDQEVHV